MWIPLPLLFAVVFGALIVTCYRREGRVPWLSVIGFTVSLLWLL